MLGYIHSLQSLGTVDGPGVRTVVFAAGCPLRCVFCHNPDTWRMSDGVATEHTELAERIKRFYPYIKNGGVTLSGGEPLMQAEFFLALTEELHRMGLHVALDTSGAVFTEDARALISSVDLVLLDVKFTTDDEYKRHTGGSLSMPIDVLSLCERIKKPVWIRQVVIPGINDTEKDAIALRELLSGYSCIEKIELLPFRKLCLEKYESLGIPFLLSDVPEATPKRVAELHRICTASE